MSTALPRTSVVGAIGAGTMGRGMEQVALLHDAVPGAADQAGVLVADDLEKVSGSESASRASVRLCS